MKKNICPRCSGRGKIGKYNHVESGICFECHGAGFIEVEDDTKDIIAEIRADRTKNNEIEKEFNKIWEQYKYDISRKREWKNYIFCEGTPKTTKQEEQYIRINQYINYRNELKEYLENNPNLIEKDFDEIQLTIDKIENKYLYSRE